MASLVSLVDMVMFPREFDPQFPRGIFDFLDQLRADVRIAIDDSRNGRLGYARFLSDFFLK